MKLIRENNINLIDQCGLTELAVKTSTSAKTNSRRNEITATAIFPTEIRTVIHLTSAKVVPELKND